MSDVATRTPLILPAPDAQVIEVTGEDRLTHLDATTTQALKDAPPGTATAALVLDSNGNPLAMFDVLVLPDRVWLVSPSPDVTSVVMDVIAGRTFLADARFAPLDHIVVRTTMLTDDARRVWSGTTTVPDPGAVRTTPSGGSAIAADADGTLTLVGPAAEVATLVERLRGAGAVDADDAAADAWHVAAGRPAWGREVAPPHLPEELGLLPTHVHLAKGCYPGQEAVARMWMLGRPRRRFARVRVADTTGTPLSVTPGWSTGEGRETVEVTRVADDGTALAFVPGASEPGGTVTTADAAITVLEVVGDDPVPPGHDPAMKRRRDRDRA